MGNGKGLKGYPSAKPNKPALVKVSEARVNGNIGTSRGEYKPKSGK